MTHINPASIKLVDGFKIRSTLDADFGAFHGHSTRASSFAPKYYIPHNEWWLDVAFQEEKEFLIKLEMFETPTSIHSEPERRAYTEKYFIQSHPIPNFIIKKKRRHGHHVVFVEGSIVRQYLDPDFIFGGHDLVYPYIPHNEIWLEIAMDPKELPFVFQHEFLERDLMKKGKNYDVAHSYATIADKEARIKLGIGCYPGDENYKDRHTTNDTMAQKYYVTSKKIIGKSTATKLKHSQQVLYDIERPVFARLFKATISAFKKSIF